MRKRATMCGSSKSVPPFFGRQLRERSRGLERMIAFSGEQALKVSECPNRFRRVLRKVFQGIHVRKNCVAQIVAEMFNSALDSGNQAILKFLALGLKAVQCMAVAGELILELKPLGKGARTITLCDEPAAFVAR